MQRRKKTKTKISAMIPRNEEPSMTTSTNNNQENANAASILSPVGVREEKGVRKADLVKKKKIMRR